MPASPHPSDADLIRRIRNGQAGAELPLWERYRGRVRFFLMRRLEGDPEAAGDIEQDVFIALLQAVREGRLIEEGNVGAYLYKTSANLSTRWRERSKRSVLVGDADLTRTDDTPETLQLAAEVQQRLRRLLRTLGSAEKRILELRFGEELSYRQIAVKLEISEDAARQRACRTIATLRRRLEEA